jgi:hypothetical protein
MHALVVRPLSSALPLCGKASATLQPSNNARYEVLKHPEKQTFLPVFAIFPLDYFGFAIYYITKGGVKNMLYQIKVNIINYSQSAYMSRRKDPPPRVIYY